MHDETNYTHYTHTWNFTHHKSDKNHISYTTLLQCKMHTPRQTKQNCTYQLQTHTHQNIQIHQTWTHQTKRKTHKISTVSIYPGLWIKKINRLMQATLPSINTSEVLLMKLQYCTLIQPRINTSPFLLSY